jgi:hypothetical protein
MRDLFSSATGRTCHAIAISAASALGRYRVAISSRAASPARTSAMQARAPELTASAPVSGQNLHGLLASYDHPTSSWRTCQLSVLGDLAEFSETWPRAGMTRSGTAYQRQPLAPLTKGTGSGLWPTPNASDGKRGKVCQGNHGHTQHNLCCVIRQNWPTPRANGGGNAGGTHARAMAVQNGTYLTGNINPNLYEWLMGYPIGWSDLED